MEAKKEANSIPSSLNTKGIEAKLESSNATKVI